MKLSDECGKCGDAGIRGHGEFCLSPRTVLPTLPPSALEKIVAQASYLWERIDTELYEVDNSQANEQEQVSDRLERWCKIAAQGDWEKLQRRWEWEDLTEDKVHLLLGGVKWIGQSLPTWAETLAEIIAATLEFSSLDQSEISLPINPDDPIAFEDILLPSVLLARQKLFKKLAVNSQQSTVNSENLAQFSPSDLPLELLDQSAYLALEVSLLKRLSNICAQTLNFEFSRCRSEGHNLLNSLLGNRKTVVSRKLYQTFVQNLLQDGLLAFSQQYPVLMRLVATVIDFWVESTYEFLLRLKADFSLLETKYTSPLGKVNAIAPNLSDAHQRGRSVISLTFASGLKLIYKPKNLGLEVAYNQFLSWCNQHSHLIPFRVLQVIDRQTHGWIEYVEYLPCEDEVAAQRFYQGAGMLLCLLYVLGATDCHYENLIASGEHLVLIDMETLLHHEAHTLVESQEIWNLTSSATKKWQDSVLRTELLPRWEFKHDAQIAYDIGGLGSIETQQAPVRVRCWQQINTDDMHIAYETKKISIAKNLPLLNGDGLSPNDYLDDILSGFKGMYDFLSEQRDLLLADHSPLAVLQGKLIRFVFRPTKIYGVLTSQTLAPEFLRSGIDRSVQLDALSRAFLCSSQKPKAWGILNAELRSMEGLDVPYFRATSDSDILIIDAQKSIPNYFIEPSYNQALTRLSKLSASDLQFQSCLIEGSLYARVTRSPETKDSKAQTADLREQVQEMPIGNASELVQQAELLAQMIDKRAIIDQNGGLSWISLIFVLNSQRFQLLPLNDSLYDGNCGIALFLAALDYVKGGDTNYRNLALGAIQNLRQVIRLSNPKFDQDIVKNIGIGAGRGLASYIYALVKIAQFLNEPELLSLAEQVAQIITLDAIASDRNFDVMAGAAGTILGLLALYGVTKDGVALSSDAREGRKENYPANIQRSKDSAILAKAIVCGQHLLNHRVSLDNCPKAWQTVENKMLTGFSHGAAGIAYALLRLYGVTEDRRYKEAALEAIAYEETCFILNQGNWPDLRASANNLSMSSWCHGAPGIGLARLGCLSIVATESIYRDVEVAIKTTLEKDLDGMDQICCGNFGCHEVLLVAAQKLSRPDLELQAKQRAVLLSKRAEKLGGYSLFPMLPRTVFSPTFFQGGAGIGYQFIRLAYPDRVPSVLLWE